PHSQRHECDDGLTLHLIRPRHDCGLGYPGMGHQSRFHLHRRKPVTRNIDHVVDSTHDPKVSVLVLASAVTGEIYAGNLSPVLTHVTIRVVENRSQHSGPRTLDHEKASRTERHGFALASDHVAGDSGKRTR